MTRARSKSIVQAIAVDIVSHDDIISHQESVPASRLRSRSNSLLLLHKPRHKPDKIEVFDGYPLTAKEATTLWSQNINGTYNYDIIIPDESIEAIQAIANDSVLGFQSKCERNHSGVVELIQQTERVIELLNALTFKYDYVTEETADFAQRSQELIDKKTHLEDISSKISKNLEIFESLDAATKILTTSPGINIVKKQSFHQTLAKLDHCLAFIASHPSYREAETYNLKFRQCMTRSLTLIRNFLMEDLKDLQTTITDKLMKSLKASTGTFSFDLFLYTSFNSHLDQQDASHSNYYNFPNLAIEIYDRIEDHEEYIGLYSDVIVQYFRIRSSLLNDYIWHQIDTLLQQREDLNQTLVQFIQDNISFFKKILQKELELFLAYFVTPASGSATSTKMLSSVFSELTEWYKSLLEPLYDTLRNRIIRETNIGILCEITTLLQKYYEFEDSQVNSYVNLRQGSINFGELFEPILQDVQARLIFRIQLYVDEKLLKYKATPEDLNIGNRRRRGTSSAGAVAEVSAEVSAAVSSLDYEFQENLFRDFFPPVGKGLTILSNIYELINSVVFDDLAHYIVHSCIFILKGSAYKLATLHLGEVDAKLYLLKNMISLQQQLNNFDIQYVRTETTLDFTSGIFEIIRDVTTKGSGVADILRKSVPKIVNNMIDAKYEIETEISLCVSEFIELSISKIDNLSPAQPSAAERDLLKSSLEFRDNIATELPKLYGEMNRYLELSIVDFLVDSIVSRLISHYQVWYDSIGIEGEKLLEIMEVDTLYGFLSEVVSEVRESGNAANDNHALAEPVS